MHRVTHDRLLLALSLAIASPGAAQRASNRLPLADSLATWYALGISAHHLCGGLCAYNEEVVARILAALPPRR